jgi:hypothetical protein
MRYYLLATLGIAFIACSSEPESNVLDDDASARVGDGKVDAPTAQPDYATAEEPCVDGLMRCGGLCLNVAENEEHCGACDNVCAGDEICVEGHCHHDPTSGQSGNHLPDGACNPMAPAALCGAQSHCLPQPDGVPVCSEPAGYNTQYDGCNGSEDCAPAYECIETTYKTVYCLQWCTNDLECSKGDRCIPLQDAVYVGMQQYGICYDGFP